MSFIITHGSIIELKEATYKVVFNDGPLSCSVAGGMNLLITKKDNTKENLFLSPGYSLEEISKNEISDTNDNYTCHSGGCPGADIAWENEGLKYNVKTISYSFHNHKHEGANPRILTVKELEEGYAAAKIADKTLNRKFDNIQFPYIKNLLARNWFQIKYSDAIFAIAKKFVDDSYTIVEGGTGWAVQMAIDSKKTVHVYDQTTKFWYRYMHTWPGGVNTFSDKFIPAIGAIPKLTKNFAGIGTRDLTEDGRNAIVKVYKNTFSVK